MSSGPYKEVSARPGYRGPDRRVRSIAAESPWSATFLAAGCGLLVAWVGVSLGFAPIAGSSALSGALTAAAAGVAVATAMLCLLWWRISGRAPVLLVCMALVVLAATFAFGSARAVLAPIASASPLPGSTRAAGLFVVAGFVAAAAISAEIDTRLRPWRVAALAVAAVAALTPLLAVVSQGAGGLLPPSAGHPAESIVLAAVLMAVAVVSIVRAARTDRFLFAWLGLTLFGLAMVEVTAAVGSGLGGEIGRELLELASVLAGLSGIAHELYNAFADQRHRLLASLIEGRAAVARVHAQHVAARQQAHDAYSALAAIEGASRTLERAHDRLDEETRAALSAGIASEITRLQRVIGRPAPPDARVPFDLSATVRSVIAHERADGADVVADVREGLTAFGRAPDTAEAVTRLLRLARDRAPGRPVLVRTDWASGQAIIRIEDRGAGQGNSRDLDLAVCAQLLSEQDGDLQIEKRGDGGATYRLTLAAVGGPVEDDTGLPPRAEPVHQGDQRAETAQVDGLLAVSGDKATHADAARSGQLDDNVGDKAVGKAPGHDHDVEAGGSAGAAFDDDDFEIVARDDARDDVAEQTRLERDRDTSPE